MTIIRSIVEYLSRGIVLKRRMPLEFGKRTIYVSPEGGLRYYFSMKKIDPLLLNTVNQFINKNDVVWDIGSNVGYFSIAAAEKVGNEGTVLSVEADLWLCNLMNKTIKANSDRKIGLIPMCMSNKFGFEEFSIAVRSRSTNHLGRFPGSTQTGGTRKKIHVPTITMNHLINFSKAPDFIKIDIEGAEKSVMEKSDEIFSLCSPKFLIEVNIENYKWMHNFLTTKGYIIYNPEKLPELITPQEPIFNILAIKNN